MYHVKETFSAKFCELVESKSEKVSVCYEMKFPMLSCSYHIPLDKAYGFGEPQTKLTDLLRV